MVELTYYCHKLTSANTETIGFSFHFSVHNYTNLDKGDENLSYTIPNVKCTN
jgi:hypothetical protein